MSINENDILHYLENVKLGDVRRLVERLEASLGVSAEVPEPLPPPRPDPVDPPPPTAFDVVLEEVGENRLAVIRVLRQLCSLGVREARDLTRDLPSTIAEAADPEVAEGWARELRDAGATCALRAV